MSKPEILPLTGLRGVAATLVMLDHYAAVDFSAPFPLDMLPHLYLAVDMFMLLSGFILSRTYEDRLNVPYVGAGYGWFVLRRVARLYPLYALTTLLCFGLCRAGWLTFLTPDTSLAALGANLLAVQTWLWPGSSLNGPGWSISTEWFASLVLPLLLPVVLGGSRGLACWAAGVSVLVLVASAVLYGSLFDVQAPGAANIISGPQALGRCVSEFVLGMCCWRLRAEAGWVRVLGRDPVLLALLLGMAVLFRDPRLDVAFVLLCAAFLVGVSFDASAVASALRRGPLLHLGRISYSIYLVHVPLMPVRDALAQGFGTALGGAAWPAAVGCCAVLVLVLATVTRRWVEVPGRRAVLASAGRWQRVRATRRGTASPAGSAAISGSAGAASGRRPGC